jgi:hypothetical protein
MFLFLMGLALASCDSVTAASSIAAIRAASQCVVIEAGYPVRHLFIDREAATRALGAELGEVSIDPGAEATAATAARECDQFGCRMANQSGVLTIRRVTARTAGSWTFHVEVLASPGHRVRGRWYACANAVEGVVSRQADGTWMVTGARLVATC